MEPASPRSDGVVTVQAESDSIGVKTMGLADRLRPHLAKMFEDVLDEDGRLVRPSRLRAIALRLARRRIVHEEQTTAEGEAAAGSEPTEERQNLA